MITNDRKEWILRHQGNRCKVCKRSLTGKAVDFHHAGQHNTKANRLNFPLFLNSVLNVVAVCRECHDNHPSHGRMSNIQAELYERLLGIVDGLFANYPVDEAELGAEIEFIRRNIDLKDQI